MARRSRRSKADTVRIGDLSDIETNSTIEEGRHSVEVAEAEIKESQSGNEYISFKFDLVEGGGSVYHNASLQPQALFNLKAILLALGFDIPGKAFDLDLGELVGLECDVEVAHETYEGKKRPRITEFYSDAEESSNSDIEEELEDMEIEELEELAKALKIKGTRKMSEDDLIDAILEFDDDDIYDALEETDDVEELDYEEMSLAELKSEAKSRGFKVTRRMTEDDIIDMLLEDDDE